MRHQLTKEDRSRGGKNGSKEDKQRAGRKGFQVTYDRSPWFARNHLRYQPGMKKERQGHRPVAYEEM